MDPVQRLSILIVVLAGFLTAGCSAERLVAREVLADPIMRFRPSSIIRAPNTPLLSHREPIPTDTIRLDLQAQGDGGEQVHGTWLSSELQGAVELSSGIGLQAGYGIELTKERIWRFDGYQGGMDFQRLRHGPQAALVYDDGTSLIQVGYRYLTAFDGEMHIPSLKASTLVLRSDTKVEIAYEHIYNRLRVSTDDQPPALFAVDERSTCDNLFASIEQGFLPGINIRLDLQAVLDNGFIESPYSMVTLWNQWLHEPAQGGRLDAPQTYSESLPDSRTRWGAKLGAKFAIDSLASALEIGVGHGSGTWRVEHSSVHLGWEQRLGDRFSLSILGGAYHQTRALFYRDDYPEGPVGALWTSEKDLSSYIAWWTRVGLSMSLFPKRGRLLGIFKELTLLFSVRMLRAYYNFEGLSSENGFTRYSVFGDRSSREDFAGGWQFGGWLSMLAGF